MGHEVTIGGQRLGSGKKMTASLHNYERSTHDLGYVWRSTMSAGTLVPFMVEVGLPGDTFDIKLNVDVLTHPTIGPLFGSYKIQLDVFQIPVRLYVAELHMNMLGIGMKMADIKLPQLLMTAKPLNGTLNPDNHQINPSCIFSYLGIRGLGHSVTGANIPPVRYFNAIPFLGYWDIYKNYYANKQEEVGAVIHKDVSPYALVMTSATTRNTIPNNLGVPISQPVPPVTYIEAIWGKQSYISIGASNITQSFDPNALLFGVKFASGEENQLRASDLFKTWEIYPDSQTIEGTQPTPLMLSQSVNIGWVAYNAAAAQTSQDTEPVIVTFPLSNIDDQRKAILQYNNPGNPFAIGVGFNDAAPYGLPFQNEDQGGTNGFLWSQNFSQEGLALKTYQSDLFNNWISTEWIDGPDGISAITAIDTSAGSFTIDELNMSKKVYEMLNRIAISGGTYDDWLDAVYTHERTRSAENPMYLGGLISNLVFQEVVSNAQAAEQPLGTLAGRGKKGDTHKGGDITAKIDEPSYLMGIVSITPHIDYSQGNAWYGNLMTMDDFHKPALDEIGFQDLITDQMAYWDTEIHVEGPKFKSAGKQPAWVNYMTNVNKVYGNFADQNQQMFMVLNRRYNIRYATPTSVGITDLTTYIDPVKFNHIFADTRRDAQNFWTQIGVDITARRKMSAKVMPNL